MKYYIGVDIGGTNIKAGVVDENAQLVSKISLKTNAADGYKSVLAVIIDAVEQAVQLSGEDIDRILVPAPMVFRHKTLHLTAELTGKESTSRNLRQ